MSPIGCSWNMFLHQAHFFFRSSSPLCRGNTASKTPSFTKSWSVSPAAILLFSTKLTIWILVVAGMEVGLASSPLGAVASGSMSSLRYRSKTRLSARIPKNTFAWSSLASVVLMSICRGLSPSVPTRIRRLSSPRTLVAVLGAALGGVGGTGSPSAGGNPSVAAKPPGAPSRLPCATLPSLLRPLCRPAPSGRS